MTIQDLGSIGEFVAAIATLCTLVYLAIQIRQNTRSVRASSFQASSRDILEIIDRVAVNSDLSRLFFEGLSDYESMSDEDRRRFATYLGSLLARWESLMFQREQGIVLDPTSFSFFYQNLRVVFARPGTRQWWSKARNLYQPNVQRLVEDLMSKGPPSA